MNITRVKNGLDPDSNAQYIGLVPQNRQHGSDEQQFYESIYADHESNGYTSPLTKSITCLC